MKTERELLAEKGRILRQAGNAFLALAIFEAVILVGALGLLGLHGLSLLFGWGA